MTLVAAVLSFGLRAVGRAASAVVEWLRPNADVFDLDKHRQARQALRQTNRRILGEDEDRHSVPRNGRRR